ncbi:MAG: hypothetical protein QF614_08585 [SAR324 cluster bacterium]|nr:hypothetical protein [SAR324 cluster bacterium]
MTQSGNEPSRWKGSQVNPGGFGKREQVTQVVWSNRAGSSA